MDVLFFISTIDEMLHAAAAVAFGSHLPTNVHHMRAKY